MAQSMELYVVCCDKRQEKRLKWKMKLFLMTLRHSQFSDKKQNKQKMRQTMSWERRVEIGLLLIAIAAVQL